MNLKRIVIAFVLINIAFLQTSLLYSQNETLSTDKTDLVLQRIKEYCQETLEKNNCSKELTQNISIESFMTTNLEKTSLGRARGLTIELPDFLVLELLLNQENPTLAHCMLLHELGHIRQHIADKFSNENDVWASYLPLAYQVLIKIGVWKHIPLVKKSCVNACLEFDADAFLVKNIEQDQWLEYLQKFLIKVENDTIAQSTTLKQKLVSLAEKQSDIISLLSNEHPSVLTRNRHIEKLAAQKQLDEKTPIKNQEKMPYIEKLEQDRAEQTTTYQLVLQDNHKKIDTFSIDFFKNSTIQNQEITAQPQSKLLSSENQSWLSLQKFDFTGYSISQLSSSELLEDVETGISQEGGTLLFTSMVPSNDTFTAEPLQVYSFKKDDQIKYMLVTLYREQDTVYLILGKCNATAWNYYIMRSAIISLKKLSA